MHRNVEDYLIHTEPTGGLPCSRGLTDAEVRSLTYFEERTVPQLSGLFDSRFWERVLLQATHHSAALCHAVVALGSAHECFEHSLREDRFALEQCNKAINLLTKSGAVHPPDVYLAACMMFACLEVSY